MLLFGWFAPRTPSNPSCRAERTRGRLTCGIHSEVPHMHRVVIDFSGGCGSWCIRQEGIVGYQSCVGPGWHHTKLLPVSRTSVTPFAIQEWQSAVSCPTEVDLHVPETAPKGGPSPVLALAASQLHGLSRPTSTCRSRSCRLVWFKTLTFHLAGV